MKPLERSFALKVLPRGLLGPALAACCGLSVAQQPLFSKIEPFLGARYGMSFDLSSQQPSASGQPCVTFDVEKTSSAGDGLKRSERKHVKKSSDLVKEMGLSASAQVKSLGGTYQGSTALKIANESEVHQFSETWLYVSEVRSDTTLLQAEGIAIRDDYRPLLTTGIAGRDEFRAKCGNAFIVGMQTGSFYYGTAFKAGSTTSQSSKFQIEAKFSFKGSAKFSADFKLANEQRKTERSQEDRVVASSSESGLPNPGTVAELEKQWKAFAPKPNAGKALSLVIAPYTVAQGAQRGGLLSRSPQEEKLDILLEALWDLKTLKDGARYVLRNEDKFALGLPGGPKRAARVEHLKKVLADWTKEFDQLLQDVKVCINDYAKPCAQLANWYSLNPRITDERLLPKKYKSICYGTFHVAQGDEPQGKGAQYRATLKRGDGEMGGGPVRVSSALTIRPDGRRLVALIKTTLTEAKADQTTFEVEADTTLFDLSPDPAMGGESYFEECEFARSPIEAKPVAGSDTFGVLTDTSGKHPRGEGRYAGKADGLLRGISCLVDSGGNDRNSLYCLAPEISALKVRLVNRHDLEAEKWEGGTPKSAPDLRSLRTKA